MIKALSRVIKSQVLVQNIKYFQTNSNKIINFESDLWKSVHANISQIPQNWQEYIDQLKSHEIDWKNNNMKAVWLKVKVDQVELLKETIQIGYQIHHATKDHIILQKWLLENQKSTLPGYASHYVGCGGAVINSQNQILLVSEKYGYNNKFWSFPGGRADPNEDIYQTAEREIYEELGFQVEAVDLLLLRESTKSIFNKPDIYFAFLLRPVDENPVVKIDPSELNDYTWVDLSEIDSFKQREKISTFHVQSRILDKVNELYKSGFNFQSDRITKKIPYINYPSQGNTYSITEVIHPKK